MEFALEFYETAAGRRPVEEFLLKLTTSQQWRQAWRNCVTGGAGSGDGAGAEA